MSLAKHSPRFPLKRVIFALAIECPRDCEQKAQFAAHALGERGIQFELWEAKDIRQHIRLAFGVVSPAFHVSHMCQLAMQINLSNVFLPQIPGSVPLEGQDNPSTNTTTIEQKLGTLFVSYASEDRSFVERLVRRLDRFAERVWYDRREIIAGDSIAERINEGLQQASALIAVLSPHSVTKPWVLREVFSSLGRQLSQKGIKIIPAMAKRCEVPAIMADIRYADFTESFELGFNDLIIGLQGRAR